MIAKTDARARLAHKYRNWDTDQVRVTILACRKSLNGPVGSRNADDERKIRRQLARRVIELQAVLGLRGVHSGNLGQ